MDIPRKEAGRRKLIRRLAVGVVVVAAVAAATVGLQRMKPAAPSVDGPRCGSTR